MVYFMGAFDSFMRAEGVVSISHAKLSGCHRPSSFRIPNYYPFMSHLLVLGSCIVGNLNERCMMIVMGLYFDEREMSLLWQFMDFLGNFARLLLNALRSTDSS